MRSISADEVGIKVIHDFRNYDMQKGGLGAPLVPEFHKYLLLNQTKEKLFSILEVYLMVLTWMEKTLK